MSENEIDITCPRCNQKLKLGLYIPKEAYNEPKKPLNLNEAQSLFDPDIAKNLTFTVKDDNTITITPSKYLGKQTFQKLLAQVKSLGGNYVSQGKQSYFWIPRQK
jgi:hypothetical protein